MKEAAGEANMTVVTIIIIGVVVAIATPIIRNMAASTEKRACCVNDGGQWSSKQENVIMVKLILKDAQSK